MEELAVAKLNRKPDDYADERSPEPKNPESDQTENGRDWDRDEGADGTEDRKNRKHVVSIAPGRLTRSSNPIDGIFPVKMTNKTAQRTESTEKRTGFHFRTPPK